MPVHHSRSIRFRSKIRTARVRRQLRSYFKHRLRRFTLPLDLRGTPFQVKVWTALRKIPFGKTSTYGELAQCIGQPGAARAVGMANNKNRIGIVVPCHRVIGAGGRPVGYASGLGIQRKLLKHEAELFAGRHRRSSGNDQ
ncbi:methylated-DNA--[protein]-cysteine S-methyltransferase [bacterium]|nr:methylated-DNA--[protein]-cysteine S-methyltransferase [bacterium]